MTFAACSVSLRCWSRASWIACSNWTFGSATSSSLPESFAPRYFHHFLSDLHMRVLLVGSSTRGGGCQSVFRSEVADHRVEDVDDRGRIGRVVERAVRGFSNHAHRVHVGVRPVGDGEHTHRRGILTFTAAE